MSQSRNITKQIGGLEVFDFINSNNNRFINIAEPLQPKDAATKNYVDQKLISSDTLAGTGLLKTGNVISLNDTLPNVISMPNINTIGVIQNGSWQANTIDVLYGGTGVNNLNSNKILLGNGSNAIQTADNISIENNIINTSYTMVFTNTSNSTNNTSGAVSILGGLSVFKKVNIGGDLSITGNATVNNLLVNGSIILNDISTNNITTSNLNANNATIVNSINTNLNTVNLTSSNLNTINLTSSNLNAGNLNTVNLTTSNLNVSNATIQSIGLSDLFALNASLTNSSSTNTRIVNLTASNLISSIATIGSFSGVNLNVNNITSSNLNSINSVFSVSSVGNLSSTQIVSSNITATNITTSNISSVSSVFTLITAGSLNTSVLTSTNTSIINLSATNNTISNSLISSGTFGSIINTNLINTNITNTNLLNTNITSTNLINTNLINTNITSTNLVNTNLINTNITNTNLTSLNHTNTNLVNTNLLNVNSTITNLINTNLINVNLVNTNLTSSNLVNTNLLNTNITNTNLITQNHTNTNTIISNGSISNLISEISTISNIKINNSNITNNSTTNMSLTFGKISQATISNFISTNSTQQNVLINTSRISNVLDIGSNKSYTESLTSGTFLTVLPSSLSINQANTTSSFVTSNFLGSSVYSSVNPMVTQKGSTMYIQNKLVEGANQVFRYNAGLAIGSIPVSSQGSLNGAILLERQDGNWYSGMYIEENTNKFVLANGSFDGGAGISLHANTGTSIKFAHLTSSTDISYNDFAIFNNISSSFLSTNDSVTPVSGAVVFNGGIGISKSLSVNSINNPGYNILSPIENETVTIGNLISSIILKPTSTLANLTFTLPPTTANGRLVSISSTRQIDNITFNNSSLVSSNLPPHSSKHFIYVSSENLWYIN
jgi:uncharacterized protein YjbI with pentapeptide repeats